MDELDELSSGFMPHGHCVLWRADLLTLHVVSDAIILLSYLSIPFALLYFIKRKKVQNRPVVILFAMFIVSCGLTHAFNIWNFWHADYWLSGFFTAACAAISGVTAIALWVLMPRALRLPTVEDIEKLNRELKMTNEELDSRVQQKTHLLHKINQELIQIHSIISHDLGNSLQVIKGYSDLAAKSPSIAEINISMKRISGASSQIQKLISDLTGRVDVDGNSKFIFKHVELKQVVDSVIAECWMELNRVHASVECSSLPRVNGVQSLLHQLFTNLFSNSIKYRCEDRPLIIKLSWESAGDSIIISFEDNGIGIDGDDTERVFEMNYRGSSAAARTDDGSGIGLAFCRKICRIHGGDIFVDKEVREGSRFLIYLISKAENLQENESDPA